MEEYETGNGTTTVRMVIRSQVQSISIRRRQSK